MNGFRSYLPSPIIAPPWRVAGANPGNGEFQCDLFVSLFKVTTLLLQSGERNDAGGMARRLEAQARLLTERFPRDGEHDAYLPTARALLAQSAAPPLETPGAQP